MNRGLAFLLLAFAAAVPVLGQSPLTATYVLPDGNSRSLADGTTITLPSIDVNGNTTATIDIFNPGSTSGTVTNISVTGAAFRLSGAPLLPATIASGQHLRFGIVFSPVETGTFTGTYRLDLNGTSIAGALEASTTTILTASYTLADGNARPLPNGTAVTFPSIGVNAVTTATIDVFNPGPLAGTITGISVSGSAFRLSDTPSLPATIAAGQSLRFGIVFAPPQKGTFTGTYRIDMNGGSLTGTVSGTTTPDVTTSYTLADGNVRPLPNGTTITFATTDVNTTSTATIDIFNPGPGTATIAGISLTGTAFRLTGIPLLPGALAPAQHLRFGIVFAPTQTGTFTETFRIDLDGSSISGTVTGTTSPTSLTVAYSFDADGNFQPISNGATIQFPATDVNGTSTATIYVANQGTGTGTVTGISLTGSGFRLTGVSLPPISIPAGQTLRFGVAFAPTQPGTFTGTLRIDLNGTSFFATVTGTTAAPNLTVAYAFDADGNLQPISNGATIRFPSTDINGTTTATIFVTNKGTGTGTVTGIFLAADGFRLTGLPLLPATIPAGQTLRFGIVFAPTNPGTFTGSFRIDLSNSSLSGFVAGSTASPKLSLAYVDSDSNTNPLQDSSTLPFPNTLVNTASTLVVVVTNTGAGTGVINSISLGAGSLPSFQLVNLPSLPLSVAPSQQTRFGVRFSPQLRQTFSGTLLVDLGGQVATLNLQGQGIAPQFMYSWIDRTSTVALLPGNTVAIADTAVGQTSNVTVSVVNTGTAPGQISAITVTGAGFSLSDLPAVPFTLRPDESNQRFTLNFTPTQAGIVTGRLTIGSDTFTITGTALGARLLYSYTNSASATPVLPGGSVILTPIGVGSSESVDFSIQNTGTTAATIASITLTAPSTVFVLQNLPALPMRLDPGASTTFSVGFTPNDMGILTASLRINDVGFGLSGTSTQPPSLPSYQFQGRAGTQQPAQQPAMGLALSTVYPLSIQGTLTLSFVTSVFADDPAIQFSSGGRTVNFTIPANSTQALFNGSATTILLQTGTVAGDIVLTPSFTIVGGFNITPSSPSTMTMTVPRAAPQLLNASITDRTLTSFTVVLNGYSTTRSIRQLDVQITPRAGETFNATHLTLDANTASTAWFQTPSSQGFGSTFSLTVPFQLQNGSSTDNLVGRLQSLAITATNEVGVSSVLTVPVQ